MGELATPAGRLVGGHCSADLAEVVGQHGPSGPAFPAGFAVVAAAIQIRIDVVRASLGTRKRCRQPRAVGWATRVRRCLPQVACLTYLWPKPQRSALRSGGCSQTKRRWCWPARSETPLTIRTSGPLACVPTALLICTRRPPSWSFDWLDSMTDSRSPSRGRAWPRAIHVH